MFPLTRAIHLGHLLWMDEILHHFKTMVETTVGWYLHGNHPSRVSEVVRNGFRPSTVFLTHRQMLPFT